MAVESLSVPQLVKMISSGITAEQRGDLLPRLGQAALPTCPPKVCMLDGLP